MRFGKNNFYVKPEGDHAVNSSDDSINAAGDTEDGTQAELCINDRKYKGLPGQVTV